MRALVVAPQPFFTPRGTPFSVYYRTLIMAKAGVSVDLVTYGQGNDVDIPGVRILRIPRLGVRHVRVGPSFLKLILDIVLFVRVLGLLITRRYDFVHAHEEAVFFCAILKPIMRFKLVYDMHSSLPQQLTNFDFTNSRLAIYAFDRLERFALRRADYVITICPDLYDYANELIPDPERHDLIENSLFEPVRLVREDTEQGKDSQLDILSDARLRGKRLVVYAGTLEAYQGIDLLVRAFPHVIDSANDALLVVAGGSPDQVDHYRAMATELGLESHCHFTGSVPKPVATELNARASVLVSTRVTGGNTPLKIYEQLASGIPLVATNIRSHTQVLNDKVAFLAELNPESIAESILQALEDPALRESKVRAARALYLKDYSAERYTEKIERMLKVLDECVESRG